MISHDVAPCEMHVSSVGAVVPQAAKFETQGQPFLQPKMPKGNEKASKFSQVATCTCQNKYDAMQWRTFSCWIGEVGEVE